MNVTLTVSIVTSLSGETPINITPGAQTITKTGKGFYNDTVAVGTGNTEHTDFGGLGTYGIMYARNMDSTNFVDFGSATGDYFIRIKAGESYVWRLVPASTFWYSADTATCECQITILED